MTKKEIEFFNKAHDMYISLMSGYIEGTANVELHINDAISSFFVNTIEEQKRLTEILIVDYKFNKKISILRGLIKEQKLNLLKAHFTPIFDKLETIYSNRNKVAHGVFYPTKKYLKEKDISRIPYRNLLYSYNQPLYLIPDECLKDFKYLLSASKKFNILKKGLRKLKSIKKQQSRLIKRRKSHASEKQAKP